MSLRLYSVVVDCHDIAAQARWWADVLGWRIEYEDDDEVAVVPTDHPDGVIPADAWPSTGPALVFVPVPERKAVKNRLHLDLAGYVTDDQAALVDALLAKGATRVDVGQDPERATWVVLADPEGNEFCVLRSRNE